MYEIQTTHLAQIADTLNGQDVFFMSVGNANDLVDLSSGIDEVRYTAWELAIRMLWEYSVGVYRGPNDVRHAKTNLWAPWGLNKMQVFLKYAVLFPNQDKVPKSRSVE